MNEAFVNAVRMLKGAMVEMITAGAELDQARRALGVDFAEVVQRRLPFNRPEAEMLIRLFGTTGFTADAFSPVVAVPMPRLLEVLGQVVSMYGATAVVAEPNAENGDASATSAAAPAVPDDTAPAIEPVQDDNGAVLHSQTEESEGASVATRVENCTAEPAQGELTPAQRRFLAERSLKLLMQVNRGELSVEKAMRQADTIPLKSRRPRA
jgi:hypothetical protein